MNVNGINCTWVLPSGNYLSFIFEDADISDIVSLDEADIVVEEDNGSVAYYGGYTILEAKKRGNGFFVKMIKSLSDLTESAIKALENSITDLNNMQNINNDRYYDILTLANYSMNFISPTISDSESVSIIQFAPSWKVNYEYAKGTIVTYNDKYYRVSQDHTSQEIWTPGSDGTESLYYEIEIAPDGIIVWKKPNGAYDAPNKGGKRHYPDANSDVYMSLADGNAYSPDEYPAYWQKVITPSES